MLYYI